VTVVITGGRGFLGWHLACRLRAVLGIEAVLVGRSELGDAAVARALLADAEVVFHVAGVNRADSDEQVESGNVEAAQQLADVLPSGARLVFANTTQSLLDNAYGRGKSRASELLRQAAARIGGSYVDVVLPNLYGEHGRPFYNSFVATFCHLVATDGDPQVVEDRKVPLLHAQRAAQVLMDAMSEPSGTVLQPAGHEVLVSDVLGRLRGYHATYARGDLPDLTDELDVDLFNTYRSFVFPESFPRYPQVHADPRGELFETSRAHGGTSQTFVSTTRPGRTRGDHYHLHKIERFFVVSGEAEISLRRLLTDEVVRFRLSGAQPGFVDMPTLWVHNITNVGKDDLVTMFWSDQLLDPDRPDQYAEAVDRGVSR
jgi:UDP-2-acetamido-2,6-beta-L-arabino-hexul-4-ose reductase